MTMTTTLNVGDAVLYVKKHGARPVVGNVHKVTKTQARVTLVDGNEVGPFKREAWNGEHAAIKSGSCRTYSAVWAKTDEQVAELNASAELAEEEAAEKKADAVALQEAYHQRITAELDEVKAAFGYDGGRELLTSDRCSKNVMPDGSRIYTINIPVKPCYAEQKAGWEILIVRIKDTKYYDRDYSNRLVGVESHHTYTNGGSGSFASCSGQNYTCDEDAVWNAVRSRYHSW